MSSSGDGMRCGPVPCSRRASKLPLSTTSGTVPSARACQVRKQSKPVALALPLTLSLTGLPGAEAVEAAAGGREGRLVLAEQPEEVLECQPTPLDAHQVPVLGAA